jgi:hypothetical protein
MKKANSKLNSATPNHVPNPNRVAAGKRNRLKRRGFTAAGLKRLRRAMLKNKPWEHSTGPRTKAGKAKVAANGKKRQRGLVSVRKLKADLRRVRVLLKSVW